MFTNFIQTYARQLNRQAESTDARLDIRRQDPDQQGGGAKKGEKEEELFSDSDQTSVSVAALRAFLQDFLRTIQEEGDVEEEQADSAAEAKQEEDKKKLPTSPQAAKAHQAYSSAAQSGTAESSFSTGGDTKNAAQSLGLSGDEVRTIYYLIDELKTLDERGVEELNLDPGATLLQSFVNAVEKAKTQS